MWASLLIIAVPLLAAENAAIEGAAFDRVTQAGVPNVTVKLALVSAPNEQLYTVKSDAAGEFRIEGARDGDYVASFDDPPGYLAPQRWDPACKPFHFSAGGNSTKLRVPLIPLGRLSGRVLNGEGHPVPGVLVELYSVEKGTGPEMATDDEGRFFIDNVVPGPHQLRARPVLSDTPLGNRLGVLSKLPSKPPEAKRLGWERWGWVTTYFPNAVDVEGAETIVVREGADLTGYDIHLRLAPVYRLHGVVSDEGGKPASRVELRLLLQAGYGAAEAHVQSERDGSFEFPAVPSGKWHISAEVQRDKVDWKGSAEVIMPNHDIEDVRVQIAPPFSLDFTVEGGPQRQAHQTRVILGLEPTDGGDTISGTEYEDNKSPHVEDLYPGSYRIGQWKVIPGYYLESILLGTENATGRDVYIRANSPPLRVIFRSNAARVQGSVEDGAGAKVVLLEADQEHYIPWQSLRVAACDNDGHFNIEGLRPTAYYALAFKIREVHDNATREAIFARGLWREAETLHLSEGETATLQLKVTPWPE